MSENKRLVEAAQKRILQIGVVRAKVDDSMMAVRDKKRTMGRLDELQEQMETIVRRHCPLCEAEGREQIGGEWLVACAQRECCAVLADAPEAGQYVQAMELFFELHARQEDSK